MHGFTLLLPGECFHVYISVPPSGIHLSVSPNNIVTTGTEVAISCTTNVSNPVQEITWTRNNAEVTGTSSKILNGNLNAQYSTSNLIITTDVDLNGTTFGCHAGTLYDVITLFIICELYCFNTN